MLCKSTATALLRPLSHCAIPIRMLRCGMSQVNKRCIKAHSQEFQSFKKKNKKKHKENKTRKKKINKHSPGNGLPPNLELQGLNAH